MVDINFIDAFESTKEIINSKLNFARENFNIEKNQKNKMVYLELINDMRKLNLFDINIINKYLKY